MSIIGIAAGPEQIADGEDPSLLAKVDEDGNVAVGASGVNPSGEVVPFTVDDSNALLRQHLAVSKAILLVLVNAFHPGTDPQSFIDAMSDK